MRYRVRQTKDQDLILILHAETFPSDDFYDHPNNIYWLITNEMGEYCGFAIAADIGENILFLARAGVLSKYRGQGLHKRLLKVREQYAKRHNFSNIITYTTIDNYFSFAHLIKMGYHLYSPEWDYAGAGVFYFKKDLS